MTTQRNARQEQVYRFVCHYAAAHDGQFPTYREIADALGLRTISAIGDYLHDLSRAGLLEHRRTPNGTRFYRITGQRVWLPDCAKDAAAQWAAKEKQHDPTIV